MWTCPSCGTANEPHAIFCAACGTMRTKAPVREAPAPLEPVPEPGPPEFRATVRAFVFWWTAATVGGIVLSWFVEFTLTRTLTNAFHQDLGALGTRVIYMLQWTVTSGLGVGALQAITLSHCFGRPGWSGWTWSTIAGWTAGGLSSLALPESYVPNLTWTMIASGFLNGLVGGGLTGFLQSRVLFRNLGRGSWASWALISAAAGILGNLASAFLWTAAYSVNRSGDFNFYVTGLGATLADGLVAGILTGIPLGRSFRRRCAPTASGG